MTIERLERRRRLLRSLGAAFLAWPLLVTGVAVAAPSPAGDTAKSTSLGGYSLLGRATAIRTLYDTPGSLPVGPLFEVTAPEAQASLVTGPFGSALSSMLYPGPLIEGGPALLASQGLPTENAPAYPVVVRASSSGPPEASDEPTPGTTMYARVDGTVAEARSTSGPAEADQLLSAGGSRSVATSVVEGPLTRATAVAEVNDIVALGGLLRIESVRSELESSSDAATGSSDGRTVVAGATFAGASVTIDEDGMSAATDDDADNVFDPLFGSGPEPPDPDDLLGALGISIRVAEPAEKIDGATVTRVSEGLVIAFDQEIGDTALDGPIADVPFPPIPGSPVSGPSDLLTIITNRQVAEISIARASVTTSASPGFEPPSFGAVAPPAPDALPGASTAGSPPGLTPSTSGAGPSGDIPATTGTPQLAAASPVPSPLGSLGPTTFIGLLVFAALGSLLLTLGTRKLPEWALDGGIATDTACSAPNHDREEIPT